MQDPLLSRKRRTLIGAAGGAVLLPLLPLLALPARAQAYPNKPIRLVVAFGSGSGNDIIARDLARLMGELLGQSIVVDNRTGGGGSIGTDAVAKAAPDGYTIGLGTSSQLVMNVGLYKTLPFDVERDLRAIGLVARTPLVLVASTAMPKTLRDLITHAKANPGKVTYGSGGAGSISHIVGEAFAPVRTPPEVVARLNDALNKARPPRRSGSAWPRVPRKCWGPPRRSRPTPAARPSAPNGCRLCGRSASMPADQPAIVARRRARQAFDTCGIRPGVGVTRYLALAGHFCYRGDRFVADNETAFDVWMHYPDVVNPEPRVRTADAE